jgi:hypothetical protein
MERDAIMGTQRKDKRSPDLGHLRHRPREVYYVGTDVPSAGQANFALRREFEAITQSHNNLVDELSSMLAGTSSSGVAIRTYPSSSGGGGADTEDTGENGDTGGASDEKVALAEGDTPGYLRQKIFQGDGIEILPTSGPSGQGLLISATNNLFQFSFSFGPVTETMIFHPFANNVYSFDLDKPLPDGTLGPLTYETYKKFPNRLWLRFSGSEFGICTITGRIGAVSVG